MQVIEKPWGKEEVLEINSKYMVKRLTMLRGCRCSLQYHNEKKESIYVLSGELAIYLGKDKEHLERKIFKPGEHVTINPGEIHRMEGETDAVYLEASTPEMEDVVRVEDDFGRAT